MRSISIFLLPSLVASAYALESVPLGALSGSSVKKLVARQPLISGQFLMPRQASSCAAQGQKECGSGCIDLTWTCCQDKAGGCPPTDNCVLGSNGKYGCCEKGEFCRGEGGARTELGPVPTSPPISGGGDSSSGSGGGSSSGGSCDIGEKPCGPSICIKTLDICCPDFSGGCPLSSTCQKGDDGKFGCCAIGKNCRGSAPGNPNLPGSGGGSSSDGEDSDDTFSIPSFSFSIPSFTFGNSRPTNALGGGSDDSSSNDSLGGGNSALPTSGSFSGGGNTAGGNGQVSEGSSIKSLLVGAFAGAAMIAGYLMV